MQAVLAWTAFEIRASKSLGSLWKYPHNFAFLCVISEKISAWILLNYLNLHEAKSALISWLDTCIWAIGLVKTCSSHFALKKISPHCKLKEIVLNILDYCKSSKARLIRIANTPCELRYTFWISFNDGLGVCLSRQFLKFMLSLVRTKGHPYHRSYLETATLQ